MNNNHKAQSIFEYSLLAMLVIVGIIVMGPYVIRSVNAHFKLWQESVDDSSNDRMTKVNMHLDAPQCKCSGKSYGACGGRYQNTNTKCDLNARYWYTPCTPYSCGFGEHFEEGCDSGPESESICCMQYNACSISYPLSSCCGTAPLVDPAHPRTTTDPRGFAPLENTTDDPRNSCYYGEEIAYNQCYPDASTNLKSSLYPSVRCKPRTDGLCNAACTGNLLRDKNGEPIVEFCPGANEKLTKDTPITLIGTIHPPPVVTNHAIKYSFDNGGSIFASDASGLQGIPLAEQKTIESPRADEGYKILHSFDLNNVSTNTIYLLVNVDGGAGNAGFTVQDTTTGQCFTPVNPNLHVTGMAGNPDVWVNNPCWVNLDKLPKPYSNILLKESFTPPAQENSTNTTPIPSCPDYNQNPGAQKCLVTCKTGYMLTKGYDNALTCIPCSNGQCDQSNSGNAGGNNTGNGNTGGGNTGGGNTGGGSTGGGSTGGGSTGGGSTGGGSTGGGNTGGGTGGTGQGGSGGCFIAGTKVLLATGQSVAIESVKIGDILLGSAGGQNKVTGLVSHEKDRQNNDWKLYSFNGGPFFVTANHPFMTKDGWKAIDPASASQDTPNLPITQLNSGDEILTKSGSMKIEKIESKVFEKTIVYNLVLDGSHEYYADDYLVHNVNQTN